MADTHTDVHTHRHIKMPTQKQHYIKIHNANINFHLNILLSCENRCRRRASALPCPPRPLLATPRLADVLLLADRHINGLAALGGVVARTR